MSFEYRPYVKINTNTDISKLKYQLTILSVSLNKKINVSSNKVKFNIDANKKYNFIKSGSNYRTDFVKLFYSQKVPPTETLRDLVIIFDLFRVTSDGKEHHIIKRYVVNNTIEEFELSNYQNVKLDVINYLEKKDPTQPIDPKNSNTVKLPITTKRIFTCKEHPPNTDLDPFSKEAVEASLFARIKEPYPDQRTTNLCGPAAFFFCVLGTNTNVYKKIVKGLWEKGEVTHNRLTIKPRLDGARVVSDFYNKDGNTRISSVDWITMASLRDSSNSNLRYDSASGSTSAITTPDEIKDWFNKIGFSIPYYQSIWRQKVIRSVDWKNILKELYKYPSKDYYYVFLTNSEVTEQGEPLPNKSWGPSHYIVLNSALSTKSGIVNSKTGNDEIVSASCFNWGEIDKLKPISLKRLSDFLWAVLIVKRELL